jgi:hypothetical protein
MALNPDKKKQLKAMRLVIADAFTFVRSQEANQAIAGVSLDQLIAEQIARNGESDPSAKSVYSPYDYATSPDAEEPSSTSASEVSPAFSTGIDTTTPTKLDRLEAVKGSLNEAINSFASLDDQEVYESFDELDDYLEEDGPIEDTTTLPAEDFVEHLADVLS